MHHLSEAAKPGDSYRLSHPPDARGGCVPDPHQRCSGRCTEVQALGRVVRLACVMLTVFGCATRSTPLSPPALHQPSSEAVPVEADDPVWGNPTAPVTVVAFLDFECAFCARGFAILQQLRTQYDASQLRVVIKHSPLPFHRRGIPAAVAAQTVFLHAGAEAFQGYAAALFEDPTALSDARLERLASDVGVPPESLRHGIADPEIRGQVDGDLDLASALGISGVPAFYVNGARLVGARPPSEFTAIVDHELRAANALVASGTPAIDVYASRVAVNFRSSPAPDPRNDDQVAFVVPVGHSPVLGPPDAWVTIVEFADFECPFCAHVQPVIKRLMEQHPGKVRWVIKHHPLDFHALAVPAAILALEVRAQRGDVAYFAALDRLLAARRLDQRLLTTVAAEFQLDAQRYAASLATGRRHPQLVADGDLAMDLQARGTPHFFVNGRRIAGAQPIERFQTMLEEEFAKVAALRAQGLTGAPYEMLQARAQRPPGLVAVHVEPPDATTPSVGPHDAPILVQMFSDFECGYCRQVMTTLDQLRQRHPERVRIVWRHLPLSFHRHARIAARAAMEVRAQRGDEAFWQFARMLFGLSGGDYERLSRSRVMQAGMELGVTREGLEQALAGGVHDAVIDRDIATAARLGITGTPTLVVNGYQLVGAQPLERIERLVRLSLDSGSTSQGSPEQAENQPQRVE